MECTICYDIKENWVQLDCKHSLCIECYQCVLEHHPRCPFCRYQIEPEYPEYTSVGDIYEEDEEQCYNKWLLTLKVTLFIGSVIHMYLQS
jgi:hypothetical protein